MIPLQLFGIVVALGALHLSYLYFKRKDFNKQELIFWFIIWMTFIYLTLFPRSIQPFVGFFKLERPMDFIMIVAFIILFSITFRIYVITNRNARKLEQLTRNIALKDIPNSSE